MIRVCETKSEEAKEKGKTNVAAKACVYMIAEIHTILFGCVHLGITLHFQTPMNNSDNKGS